MVCLQQNLKAELARQQEAAQKAEAKAAACEQALQSEQSREGSTHALQQVCPHVALALTACSRHPAQRGLCFVPKATQLSCSI